MRKIKQYVVPGEYHTPHLVRETSLILIGIIAIFLFVISYSNNRFLTQTRQGAAIITAVLIDLTNKDRLTTGLPALHENSLLESAAALKAADMATKGYFAHTSPEGITPWDWFDEVGYTFKYAGENLAVNFTESKDVVEAWMDSPSHRDNILSAQFTEIGIATREGEYKGEKAIFIVQLFGQPAAIPAVPKVALADEVPEPEATPILETETLVIAENKNVLPSAAPILGATVASANTWETFLVKYPLFIEHLYTIIMSLLFFVLVLMLMSEFRMHHTRSIVYTTLALILLATLILLNRGLVLIPT